MQLRCPLCGKTTTWEENPWRPFCSERCKLTDLGRWASEKYRIHEGPGPSESDTTGDSGSVTPGQDAPKPNDRREP